MVCNGIFKADRFLLVACLFAPAVKGACLEARLLLGETPGLVHEVTGENHAEGHEGVLHRSVIVHKSRHPVVFTPRELSFNH